MATVFVIFARADGERVRPALEALQAAGIDVEYDLPDMPLGERVDRAAGLIKASPAVVALLTEATWASDPFERELRIANDYGKRVIPASLEEKIDGDAWERLRAMGLGGGPGVTGTALVVADGGGSDGDGAEAKPETKSETETDAETGAVVEPGVGAGADPDPDEPAPVIRLWSKDGGKDASWDASKDEPQDPPPLRQEGLDELIAAVNVAIEEAETAARDAAAAEADAPGKSAEAGGDEAGAVTEVDPALAGALWESVRNSTDLVQLRNVRRMLAQDPYFSLRAEARIEELLRRKREQDERAERARVRERMGSVGASLLAVGVAALLFWAIVNRNGPQDGDAVSVADATALEIASLEEQVADLSEQLALAEEAGGGATATDRATTARNAELTAANAALTEANAGLTEANADLTESNAALTARIASLEDAARQASSAEEEVQGGQQSGDAGSEALQQALSEVQAAREAAEAAATDLATATERAADLERDLTAAQTRTAELETALQDLTAASEDAAAQMRELEVLEGALEKETARAAMLEEELATALSDLDAARKETAALQAFVDRDRVLRGLPAGASGSGMGGAGVLFDHYLAELDALWAQRQAAQGAAARIPTVTRGDLISLQFCIEREQDILVGADGQVGLRTMRAIADLDPASAAMVLKCVQR